MKGAYKDGNKRTGTLIPLLATIKQ